MDRLWDVRETANAFHVSPWTVRRWVRERRLPVIRLGRAVRFDPLALQRHIAANSFEARDENRFVLPALPTVKSSARRAKVTRAHQVARSA
jgi:excisionase family DNA binding protein